MSASMTSSRSAGRLCVGMMIREIRRLEGHDAPQRFANQADHNSGVADAGRVTTLHARMKVRTAEEAGHVHAGDRLRALAQLAPFACVPDRRFDGEIALSRIQLEVDGRRRTCPGSDRLGSCAVRSSVNTTCAVLERADADAKPVVGTGARGHLAAELDRQPVARTQRPLSARSPRRSRGTAGGAVLAPELRCRS